jgi:hypothetical protein
MTWRSTLAAADTAAARPVLTAGLVVAIVVTIAVLAARRLDVIGHTARYVLSG